MRSASITLTLTLLASLASAIPLNHTEPHLDSDLQPRAKGFNIRLNLDSDVGLYCKTDYGNSRIKPIPDTEIRRGPNPDDYVVKSADRLIELQVGEDLDAKPIHFTQVSFAFSNPDPKKLDQKVRMAGKYPIEHEVNSFAFAI
jgi:hypothetical protein